MVGLADISTGAGDRKVKIRGKDIPIPGINARGVVALIGHYPAVEKMFGGQGTNPEDLTPESMIHAAPDLVRDILVLGTGDREYTDEAVAGADDLALGEQVELLSAVLEVTMPSGIGPFIEQVQKMLSGLGLNLGFADNTKAPVSR